jgi:hypothetical protein
VEHVLRTLSIYKYTINERGVKFTRLCGGSFLLKFIFLKATVRVERHQKSKKQKLKITWLPN